MKNNNDKNLFLVFFCLVLAFTFSACSSKNKNGVAYNIKLQHDAWVKSESKEPSFYKKGETVQVKDEVIIIETPGYVDAVLVPPTGDQDQLKLGLRPIPYWTNKNLSKYANNVITDILSRTNRAQLLLGKNKASDALKEVHRLEKDYPDLTYI